MATNLPFIDFVRRKKVSYKAVDTEQPSYAKIDLNLGFYIPNYYDDWPI
jgi:hypothetical protein